MRTILNRATAICILLLLPGYNAFPLEHDLAVKLDPDRLRTELSGLFNSDEAKQIFWGVRVVRLKDDHEIFSLNKNKRFRPASNMKVVIAAAALKALNAEYQFETKLFIDGKVTNGTLKGNLVVVGSGDPTFTMAHFAKWVEDLRRYKIKRITGDIIGVDSIFDDQKTGLLWSWDDLSNCYSAQISGLQINGNCVQLKIVPGVKRYLANVQKLPYTSYVEVLNNARTTGDKTSLRFKRQEDSNKILIDGVINQASGGISKWVSVNNPTLYFSTLLYEDLRSSGFIINGRPSDARDTGYVLNRNSAYQISVAKSPPLKSIINDFLKHSINLYGESILKALGFIYFNEGTTYNGRLAVNLILKQYELPEDVLFIADGSGLSMLNLISPEYMTTLLYSISKSYFSRTFFDALSTSGMDGTLRKRLDSSELKGNVHAKTGYIRNSRTLSGYIDTVGGDRLTFAIFANNYDNRLDKAESVINKACTLMRRYGEVK